MYIYIYTYVHIYTNVCVQMNIYPHMCNFSTSGFISRYRIRLDVSRSR